MPNRQNQVLALVALLLLSACGVEEQPKEEQPKVVSCSYTEGQTVWADGTTQKLPSTTLGELKFSWWEKKGEVETSVLDAGQEVEKKFPAKLVGSTLTFTTSNLVGNFTNQLNLKTKKLQTTTSSDSPDGRFTLTQKGFCLWPG